MADERAGEVPRTTFRQPVTRLHPAGTTRSSTRATVEPPRFAEAPTTQCRHQPGTGGTGDNFPRKPFTRRNHLPGRSGFMVMTSRHCPRTWASRHQTPARRRAGASEGLRTPTSPRRPSNRRHLGIANRTPTSHGGRPGEERTPLSWNHTLQRRPGETVAPLAARNHLAAENASVDLAPRGEGAWRRWLASARHRASTDQLGSPPCRPAPSQIHAFGLAFCRLSNDWRSAARS
jgi:hypothetical protein